MCGVGGGGIEAPSCTKLTDVATRIVYCLS